MGEQPLTEEEQRSAIITTITLDISNKHLKEVPKTIKNFSNIEFLYLSTNDIKSIPDTFFSHLPQLKWLDFRHNKLTSLPTSIGDHRELRTLLLQGNLLTKLPIQLGNIPTLTGLNIADNPLDFPPTTVLQSGTHEIVKYLRVELHKESLLIAELADTMENVHVTENEGYLGRKLSYNSNRLSNPHPALGPRGYLTRPDWELSYTRQPRHIPGYPKPPKTAPVRSSNSTQRFMFVPQLKPKTARNIVSRGGGGGNDSTGNSISPFLSSELSVHEQHADMFLQPSRREHSMPPIQSFGQPCNKPRWKMAPKTSHAYMTALSPDNLNVDIETFPGCDS